MKKNVMLQFFLLILFVFGYTLASAQDYIITLKGDTLRGKVRYFNSSSASHSTAGVKYLRLTSDTGKKTTYQVLQTRGFQMDNEIYHTLKLGDSYTFMKLMSQGYLSMYSYQHPNQTDWVGRYLLKKDGSNLDVPNIAFKKRIAEFLADCPGVSEKIETGEWERSGLGKIVDDYNACVGQSAALKIERASKKDLWVKLYSAVEVLPDFSSKVESLEMIDEIYRKIGKNEKIPSFLINGVKDSLKDQPTVKEKLDAALQSLN